MNYVESTDLRPRVVIVGAGFGGLSAAQALRRAPVSVTLIDQHNYHLFQPLLYQVATAGLSPAEIAWPIRGILRDQANALVLLDRVTGIDLHAREVVTRAHRVAYDYLVLATGAAHAYFGHGEWARRAPGLKDIDDATEVRRRILMAFERAETEPDPVERRRLLTFVIVGAGPTGVELAGAIAELAKRALARDFRAIDPRAARISLVEAGPRILPNFPESLANAAQRALARTGVDVRTGAPVTGLDEGGATLGLERIEARTVLWAAGVAASPAAAWVGVAPDRVGRIKVAPDLSVPGHPEVFAVGDTALTMQDGHPLPGLAPVAKQQGAYVGAVIHARVVGKSPPASFRYRNYGNLATVGRKFAVVDLPWLRLSGFVAWLLWCVAHVYYLIGARSRLIVAINWLWAYFRFQPGARLITEREPHPAAGEGTGSHSVGG